MKPSDLIGVILPKLGPIAGLLASKLGAVDEDETMQTVAAVISAFAEKDGMSPDDFIRSGRAIEVLSALARGAEPGPRRLTAELAMFRCEKCNHVHYKIS